MHILCKINVCLWEGRGRGEAWGFYLVSQLCGNRVPRAREKLMVDQWSRTPTGLTCGGTEPLLARCLGRWKREEVTGTVLLSGLLRSWRYLHSK